MIKTTLALLFLAVIFLPSGCGFAYRTRIEEFRSDSIPGSRFTAIAILPVNERSFDPQIAARVRENLRKQGITIVPARSMMPESEVSMAHLCPKDNPPEYQGVLWVTFEYLLLRDCQSTAVAFRAEGGYAGVDAMAKRLVLYLKSQSGTTN
jgi:hypothetical protein